MSDDVSKLVSTNVSDNKGSKPTASDVDSRHISTKTRAESMINHLIQMARAIDDANGDERVAARARAEFAGLRQITLNPLRAIKYITPYLDDIPEISDDDFYLVASLFALHRMHDSHSSLGEAFSRINESDSTEDRFFALLSTSRVDLADRLRGIITLLAAKKGSLNWYQLINDVIYWDAENHPVQRRLAREFYKASNEDASDLDIDTAEEAADRTKNED